MIGLNFLLDSWIGQLIWAWHVSTQTHPYLESCGRKEKIFVGPFFLSAVMGWGDPVMWLGLGLLSSNSRNPVYDLVDPAGLSKQIQTDLRVFKDNNPFWWVYVWSFQRKRNLSARALLAVCTEQGYEAERWNGLETFILFLWQLAGLIVYQGCKIITILKGSCLKSNPHHNTPNPRKGKLE